MGLQGHFTISDTAFFKSILDILKHWDILSVNEWYIVNQILRYIETQVSTYPSSAPPAVCRYFTPFLKNFHAYKPSNPLLNCCFPCAVWQYCNLLSVLAPRYSLFTHNCFRNNQLTLKKPVKYKSIWAPAGLWILEFDASFWTLSSCFSGARCWFFMCFCFLYLYGHFC